MADCLFLTLLQKCQNNGVQRKYDLMWFVSSNCQRNNQYTAVGKPFVKTGNIQLGGFPIKENQVMKFLKDKIDSFRRTSQSTWKDIRGCITLPHC